MALSQVYTAVAGHTITADRWNNEFGNIYGNGTDLAFPLTKAVSFGGFTITWDAASVTTIASSASQAWQMTPGAKSGTPSTTGGLINIVASTYTDNNTSGSGTATAFAAHAFQRPTLAATNASVVTTNGATVYIANAPANGTNETITNPYALWIDDGNMRLDGGIALQDSRTATAATPLTVIATTTGTPAAGIGTGILFQAESADENPSNFGQLEFDASDIDAGSEDTYLQVLLRVAGAALTSCWRFAATGAFNGIFTHANTAARTYTMPNFTGGVMIQAGTAGVMSPINDNSTTTTAHGLGATPSTVLVTFECLSDDSGVAFLAGQRIYNFGYGGQAGVDNRGVTILADTTNTHIIVAAAISAVAGDDWAATDLTEANWKITATPYMHT